VKFLKLYLYKNVKKSICVYLRVANATHKPSMKGQNLTLQQHIFEIVSDEPVKHLSAYVNQKYVIKTTFSAPIALFKV